MPKHAYLSASSAHRWLACPKSAALNAKLPDESSPYAAEGTDCHELCAYEVEKALGRDVKDPTEDLSYYNTEMQNSADSYRDYVLEQLDEAKKLCRDPTVYVEQHVDFSRWVPNGFGTADCIIAADDLLQIIDMKYGLGVMVTADDETYGGNPQLMCYALGVLEMLDGIYDIENVRLTIFQPRRENISTYDISKKDLLDWADNVLKPGAALAYNDEGDFHAGAHCQFCKVKATCRKRAEYNLEMAKYDFAMPDTLSDEEIAAILPDIEHLISWANDVKDYALEKAESGTHIDGYKLVEGRSIRKYTDETVVAEVVEKAGFDPFDKKLKGITAMTNLLGKKKFNDLLGDYIIKPPGKPTLVPESDKRPEMKNSAVDDFKESE
ncbi:MAG: DUF2800 domain-containing protein [Lactobacillus sp.]|nr:MAG: DUF2800 domain-containing protein [Lactobacillus sp.]